MANNHPLFMLERCGFPCGRIVSFLVTMNCSCRNSIIFIKPADKFPLLHFAINPKEFAVANILAKVILSNGIDSQ